MVNIKQLKANLLEAICDGYADYELWFDDDDDIRFTIDLVYYRSSDGTCILQSDKGKFSDQKSFSVLELLEKLDGWENDDRNVLCIDEKDDEEHTYTIDDGDVFHDERKGVYIYITEKEEDE